MMEAKEKQHCDRYKLVVVFLCAAELSTFITFHPMHGEQGL